jgi:Arc/MetJ-type ribon-helix-helix transcriptional regulator
MKVIQVDIPDQIYRQMENLVEEGWFRNCQDIVDQALRRFLETHQPDLMERFIREDVDWGLRGRK